MFFTLARTVIFYASEAVDSVAHLVTVTHHSLRVGLADSQINVFGWPPLVVLPPIIMTVSRIAIFYVAFVLVPVHATVVARASIA